MENLRGALLMTLAMAAFAIEDAIIKTLSETWPAGQIIASLGVGGAIVFGVVVLFQGHALLSRRFLHPALITRNLAEAFGTVCFVTSLTLIPLSLASAILQATPLAVTLGAALFLGATVGWRRWTAIFVGLAGVLLILRPGLDAFDPLALWAVGGMIGLAARDIAVRRVPETLTGVELSWLAFLTLIPTGFILLVMSGETMSPLTLPALGSFVIVVAIGVVAYYLIVQATRIGEVAVVTPFRYTRLPFALLLGVLFFAERPDALTLLGAAIVVASGLYTLFREARTSSS